MSLQQSHIDLSRSTQWGVMARLGLAHMAPTCYALIWILRIMVVLMSFATHTDVVEVF